jgi:hypothetical protein
LTEYRDRRRKPRPPISVDTETGIIRVGNLELDADVLAAMADPATRVLWAFINSSDGSHVQAVPFDETKVIWLEPSDLRYAQEAAAGNWSD